MTHCSSLTSCSPSHNSNTRIGSSLQLVGEPLRKVIEERAPSFFGLGVILGRHVAARLREGHLRSPLGLLEINGYPVELVTRAVAQAQHEVMRSVHLEVR